MIPEFLDQPGVLGIGEIGLNKNTRNEVDRVLRAPRPGDEDQRADPDSHAAPGRQVPGHADDPRHALRRPPHRPQPGAGRPRRGAHDPRRARRGLLGRHDALPGQQVHAASGPSTWSRCTAPSGCWSIRPATGARRNRRPCPTSSWPCGCAATPRALIRRIVYDNPLKFFSQSRNFDFTPPEVYEGAQSHRAALPKRFGTNRQFAGPRGVSARFRPRATCVLPGGGLE